MSKSIWPLFALAPWAIVAMPTQTPPKKATYADVEPILRAHCTSCHGGSSKKAGLDLTTVAGMRKGGLSGPSVVPGNPKASLLVKRIHGEGGMPQMPIGFAPLSKAQMATVEAWIASGAAATTAPAKHWAYVAPKRPPLPAGTRKDWVRNDIDRFVLARLEKGKLAPTPAASRATLMRRVSLDLTGLPPSPAEVDAFVRDTRPDAYERVVDRLLDSPHYGERQAQMWLDLARFADSDGYEKDLRRSIWKYRDWLISAFNRNLPYDQFTIEQIAGDLLPNPTLDQLIATGFHRNTMMNLEGGVDQEEAHFKVVLDRVDTTATVWLGSTLACARCHDHKYDPFSQKDYYRMGAFFNNAAIYPRGPKEVSEEKWFEAELPVPNPQTTQRLTTIEQKLKSIDATLKDDQPADDATFAAWNALQDVKPDWKELTPSEATSDQGTELRITPGGVVTAVGPNPARDRYVITGRESLKGVRALKLAAVTDKGLPSMGPGRAPNGNFVVTGVTLKVNGQPIALKRVRADFVQTDFSAYSVVPGEPGPGWGISGSTGSSHELVIELAEQLVTEGDADCEITIDQMSPFVGHNLGSFIVSFSHQPDAIERVLPFKIAEQYRNAGDTPELRRYVAANFEHYEMRQQRRILQSEMRRLKAEIPTTLVMRDRPTTGPLGMHLRTRGEFLSRAELLRPGTPSILAATNRMLPGNRLGLAKWLVSRGNPLSARVQVNRMWESLWGRGLVETSEDFGTQGSRPSHPELLDWLAVEFMEKGWDMKAMMRLMVTSATYRQASVASAKLRERDPENRLLARGPRFRLDAESIRDVTLATAGILDRKVGGPSVFPFQPEGVWDTPYSGEYWNTSQGSDARRRGLYTFWKRTATYPAFMAFDASSRETCTVRRTRTNTPLQALALLNDAGMFEAAKALGKRMVVEGGPNVQTRLTYGFRLCTARTPRPEELKRLVTMFQSMKTRYAAGPNKAVGETPEDAAYAMTANVLLNLDETISKG